MSSTRYSLFGVSNMWVWLCCELKSLLKCKMSHRFVLIFVLYAEKVLLISSATMAFAIADDRVSNECAVGQKPPTTRFYVHIFREKAAYVQFHISYNDIHLCNLSYSYEGDWTHNTQHCVFLVLVFVRSLNKVLLTTTKNIHSKWQNI